MKRTGRAGHSALSAAPEDSARALVSAKSSGIEPTKARRLKVMVYEPRYWRDTLYPALSLTRLHGCP
jgi:hypothetical protein